MDIFSSDYSFSSLAVMLLPLQTDNLLIPDAMVLENCAPGDIAMKADSPEWFVGYIQWRGQSVPLISFEALNGAMAIAAEQIGRVAIVRSMAAHGHLPYYAVVVDAAPDIIDISNDDVRIHESRPRGRAEALSVSVGDTTAGIPNVDWVEQHLLTYILHS